MSLRVDASADLPLALVDPLRIRDVLANLLSNALHHTPPGGVLSIAAKTGLGLTIARNLVTSHGGTMRAESGPVQGTSITFTLLLPSPQP